MKNTVYIDKSHNVYVNGTRIDKVRDYSIEQSAGVLTGVKLEFDADDFGFVAEFPQDITKKELYRSFLGKQLAFLEEAQESARENEAFTAALAYGDKILELSKEIEELDNKKKAHEINRKNICGVTMETLQNAEALELIEELERRRIVRVSEDINGWKHIESRCLWRNDDLNHMEV